LPWILELRTRIQALVFITGMATTFLFGFKPPPAP
jgi:hypothetical protein